MSGVRLASHGDHEYDVFAKDGARLGSLARTGSLPSCQRWWATKPDGSSAGPSQRTRRDALKLLKY